MRYSLRNTPKPCPWLLVTDGAPRDKFRPGKSAITCQIVVVAVGTTIADRPRTDPYKRVYALRLLPGMSGGEASIRIGMQNTGSRNPPGQERGETSPSHLCALTAAN